MDTLTRMQAFIEVVDAEGFSAAARKLGRSKALMSKYVRELEDDLGILLLNRTTRQFSLTEAGQQYYDRAIDILRRIGDLQESVRETGSGLRGRLRVSAPRSLTDLEIGLPIVEFAAEYPEITLELNLDDRIVDLVEDAYDVAIRISRLTDSTLIAKKLADFRLVLCASPDFVEKHGRPQKPRDLLQFPAIVDTNWKGRNNWILRRRRRQGSDRDGQFAVRGEQPGSCQASRACGPRRYHGAIFFGRARVEERSAGEPSGKPHTGRGRRLRGLSAQAARAGQGSSVRGFHGPLVPRKRH